MNIETKTVDDFMLAEVGIEHPEADLYCLTCGYRGIVKLTSKHHTVKIRNADLILRPDAHAFHKDCARYAYLQPSAIKLILDNVSDLLCCRCNNNSLAVCGNSKYNPARILRALTCHTI